MMKKIFMGLFAVLTISCSVDVPPPDLYSDPDAISNVKSARSLLTSCYLLYPHYEYELSVLGNDFCPTTLSTKNVEQLNLYKWVDKEISTTSTEVWLSYYNCIANCDVLEQRLPNVVSETSSENDEKKAITAECKTLKAMCYFNLLRLYSMPYDTGKDSAGVIIKSQVGVETVARTSVSDCTEYIRSLLKDAAASDVVSSSNGWLSGKASTYMLAELELYAGNYQAASDYASQVIAGCSDDQLKNVASLWASGSNTSRIFAFNTSNSYYASIQYDQKEGDYFALNPEMILAAGDTRKQYDEYEMNMNGGVRTLFGKYNKMTKDGSAISYIDMMRYAGAYFIQAECLSRLGNTQKALEVINHYLALVGSDLIGDDGDVTDGILKAKYKEFVGEGRNYFDLKRTHSDLKRLSTWGGITSGVIRNKDYRWTFPIPSSEYKYNEYVSQNTGWPINR